MATNGIKLVFGGAVLLSGDVDEGKQWLSVLEETGVNTIDLAEIYGSAEEGFGNAGAAARFTIDTKMPGGFSDKPANEENVIAAGRQSLKKLQTDSIDIYYVHAPDRKTPIKETLAGLNELHKQGAFKRLGLSNFSAEEVDEAFRVAKENGFVTPSVYQGNYSAVARRTETELFPTLRKHNLSFYAYSPIAGGLLAKSRENLTKPGSRFDPNHPFGGLYNGMYNKSSFLSALDTWAEIAAAENITRAELAYRWVVYHSKLEADKGDAVIIGASKYDQLRGTIKAIKAGPLRDESVRKIEQIWDTVKDDAALDNYEFSAASQSS